MSNMQQSKKPLQRPIDSTIQTGSVQLNKLAIKNTAINAMPIVEPMDSNIKPKEEHTKKPTIRHHRGARLQSQKCSAAAPQEPVLRAMTLLASNGFCCKRPSSIAALTAADAPKGTSPRTTLRHYRKVAPIR